MNTNLDKLICQQPPQPEPQNRWNLRVILPTKLLPTLRIVSSKSRLEEAVHDEPALEEDAQDLVQWAVEVVLLSGKKSKKKHYNNIMSLLFMGGWGDYLSSWLARKGFAFCGWDG